MEIEIEKAFSMPEMLLDAKRLKGVVKAMRTMDVGDSFVVPIGKRRNIRNLARYVKIHVAMSKIDEQTVRVWRIQ